MTTEELTRIKNYVSEFDNNIPKGERLPSAEIVAEYFLEDNPDIRLKPISMVRYVQHARKGMLDIKEDSNDFSEIRSRIADNQKTAFEAFKPAKLDTNPLGLLPEDDMNRTFFDIPETYSDYKAPKKLDSYGKKMGIISDIHLPIHDRSAVLAAHAHIKKLGIDFLVLLGDIMDCGNLTRHRKKKMLSYTWREELEVGKAYIKSLRILFPDIPIVYQLGNHEIWLEQYIISQAPELYGAYFLGTQLELDKYNIELVPDDQLMQYGDLWVHHGHVFGVGGGRHVATRLLDKHGVNLIVGHFHREVTDSKRNLDDSTHGVWVNSCLADLHPNYNPHNNSTHGFSTVDLLDDGKFQVKQYKIINGHVIGE